MVILIHVIIALTSMIYAGYLFFKPSNNGLKMSYVMIAATIGTGVYLVVSAPAHMLEACTVGLVYVAIVSTATILSHHKLSERVDQLT